MYWCFEPGQLERFKQAYRQELVELGWEPDLIDDFLNDFDRALNSKTARDMRLMIDLGEKQLGGQS